MSGADDAGPSTDRTGSGGDGPSAAEPAPPHAEPVRQAERIEAIDALRGFALLGILAMNIRMFASVFASYSNPTAYYEFSGANKWVWLTGHLFADLKMMSIFSMLFGAGIVLMTSRQERKGLKSVGVHYRRMFWLMLIGLIHAHIIWSGDILFMYAIIGMIVFWARRWPIAVQCSLGVILLAIGVGVNAGMAYSVQYWPEETVTEMRQGWAPTEERIQEEIDAYGGSWLDAAPLRSTMSLQFELMGVPFFGLWRAGGLMLLGMALFRWGVFSARRSTGFYAGLLIGGMAIGLPIIVLGYQRNVEADFSFEVASMTGTTFNYNYIGSVFVALGWVGAIMLVARSGALRWLIGALAAVGQMAFTNYLMQSIICTTIFYGHGLGYFGRFDYLEQFYVVLGVWLVELIWSPWWLKRFRFGPFEWLWRSLTYWTLQPMRRIAVPG